MTNRFTFIDLFSGIGGFRRGLETNGGTCVFSSEIDKFAAQAYVALYGDKPSGDITEIDAKDVPDHDVLAAGFPCQAFSVAGKRKGFEDTRGTIFFEIARIAKEKNPKAMLLENVKGLINHDKGNTLDLMIRTLNEIGYVIDFDVLNSKYFGVPQNRERIFIVAIREDLIESEPFSEVALAGQTIVPKGKRRISEWAQTFNFEWPEQAEVTTRLRDILESNVDEKFYLSDEKTAQLISQLTEKSLEQSDEFMVDDQGRTKKPLNPLEVSPTLRRETHGNEPRIVQPQEVRATALQNANMQGRRIKENDEPSFTVSATDRHGVTISERQTVIDDTQGFDGVRTYDDETPTLRSERSGLKVAEEVRPVLTPDRMTKRQNGRRFKDDGEESFTLTAQDRHGIAEGVRPRYRIRKLTPKECWRLQGFPDEAHDAVEAAGISDSQRYKQAGNAVTVNVIEVIGERLLTYLAD